MFKLLIIITYFVTKVLTSHPHTPYGHYVHVTAVPYPVSNYPSSNSPSPPIYQPYQQTQSQPTLTPTTVSPILEQTTPGTPIIEPTKIPKAESPKLLNKVGKDKHLDSNVLNNLAIALQLLIVSNILNKPHQDTDPEIVNMALSSIERELTPIPSYIFESSENVEPPFNLEPRHLYTLIEAQPITTSVSSCKHTVKEPSLVPNAKYLGSSSLIDPNVYGSSRSSIRATSGLMSPYEAMVLQPDPISSSSGYLKRHFKSPYTVMTERDLFSFSDLF